MTDKPEIVKINGKEYIFKDGAYFPIQKIATPESNPKKIPETNISEIPKLIKAMTKDELKTYFGTDIGQNTKNPYAITSKKFFDDYNITTGTKWKPYLTYEHKHLIIECILKGTSKTHRAKIRNACIKTLNDKISNPPAKLFGKTPSQKQLDKIAANINAEINRWA